MPADAKWLRSPALVALAGWLVPGAGYWMVEQRVRGSVIGLTIILLFVAGLFIGGIRVLEVPMYDDNGRKIPTSLVREVRLKPWSIAQIMTGPVSIIAGACSIAASESAGFSESPAGAKSHVRINEIGTLYTAVAGMLNLLAMIDASSRAARESA